MIGGTGMSLVCGRNQSMWRMTEHQEAGCSRGWMQQLEMCMKTAMIFCNVFTRRFCACYTRARFSNLTYLLARNISEPERSQHSYR